MEKLQIIQNCQADSTSKKKSQESKRPKGGREGF
jgi:hypothetical protein